MSIKKTNGTPMSRYGRDGDSLGLSSRKVGAEAVQLLVRLGSLR